MEVLFQRGRADRLGLVRAQGQDSRQLSSLVAAAKDENAQRQIIDRRGPKGAEDIARGVTRCPELCSGWKFCQLLLDEPTGSWWPQRILATAIIR